MLTKIGIRNYKSILDLEVDLKKLTIFIGPNASGKSSILDGIDFFLKAYRTNELYNKYFINFLKFEFKHYNDLVHKRMSQLPMRFEIDVKPSEERLKSLKALSGGRMVDELGYSVEFKQENIMSQRLFGKEPIIGVEFDYQIHKNGGMSSSYSIEPQQFHGKPFDGSPDKLFLQDLIIRGLTPESQREFDFAIACRDALIELIGNVFMIHEVREPISWETPLSGVHPADVGPRGENTLNVLTYIANRKEYADVNAKISEWVAHFDYSDLAAYVKSVEKTPHAASDVLDRTFDLPVNIAAAGFGFQQILPIIVQSFYTRPPGTIVIEEPEIHLHPANQMRIIDLFIDTVNYGNQVIFSTHSEHMFMRLQRRVAEGAIDPDDVAVYYVTKTVKGTQVERVEIKVDGSIPGWLPSFSEASEEEAREIFRLKTSADKNKGR